MVIDYTYFHDALDKVEHTTTINAFYNQFQAIKSLFSFVHPEIPESYFSSRFAYGLQAEFQKFVLRFNPLTVTAAYHLATIYEEAIYLDYFPEDEIPLVPDYVVKVEKGVMVKDLSFDYVKGMSDMNSRPVKEAAVTTFIGDSALVCSDHASVVQDLHSAMGSSSTDQDVVETIYESAVRSNYQGTKAFPVAPVEMVTWTSVMTVDSTAAEDMVDQVQVPFAWDLCTVNNNSEALVPNCSCSDGHYNLVFMTHPPQGVAATIEEGYYSIGAEIGKVSGHTEKQALSTSISARINVKYASYTLPNLECVAFRHQFPYRKSIFISNGFDQWQIAWDTSLAILRFKVAGSQKAMPAVRKRIKRIYTPKTTDGSLMLWSSFLHWSGWPHFPVLYSYAMMLATATNFISRLWYIACNCSAHASCIYSPLIQGVFVDPRTNKKEFVALDGLQQLSLQMIFPLQILVFLARTSIILVAIPGGTDKRFIITDESHENYIRLIGGLVYSSTSIWMIAWYGFSDTWKHPTQFPFVSGIYSAAEKNILSTGAERQTPHHILLHIVCSERSWRSSQYLEDCKWSDRILPDSLVEGTIDIAMLGSIHLPWEPGIFIIEQRPWDTLEDSYLMLEPGPVLFIWQQWRDDIVVESTTSGAIMVTKKIWMDKFQQNRSMNLHGSVSVEAKLQFCSSFLYPFQYATLQVEGDRNQADGITLPVHNIRQFCRVTTVNNIAFDPGIRCRFLCTEQARLEFYHPLSVIGIVEVILGQMVWFPCTTTQMGVKVMFSTIQDMLSMVIVFFKRTESKGVNTGRWFSQSKANYSSTSLSVSAFEEMALVRVQHPYIRVATCTQAAQLQPNYDWCFKPVIIYQYSHSEVTSLSPSVGVHAEISHGFLESCISYGLDQGPTLSVRPTFHCDFCARVIRNWLRENNARVLTSYLWKISWNAQPKVHSKISRMAIAGGQYNTIDELSVAKLGSDTSTWEAPMFDTYQSFMILLIIEVCRRACTYLVSSSWCFDTGGSILSLVRYYISATSSMNARDMFQQLRIYMKNVVSASDPFESSVFPRMQLSYAGFCVEFKETYMPKVVSVAQPVTTATYQKHVSYAPCTEYLKILVQDLELSKRVGPDKIIGYGGISLEYQCSVTVYTLLVAGCDLLLVSGGMLLEFIWLIAWTNHRTTPQTKAAEICMVELQDYNEPLTVLGSFYYP